MPFLLKKLHGSNHLVLLRDADGVMRKVTPEGTVFAHEPKGVDSTISVEEISEAEAADLAPSKEPDPSKGPTLLEWVNAGYSPDHYPPSGFDAKPFSEAELAAALKRHEELRPKVEPPAAEPPKVDPPAADGKKAEKKKGGAK